MDPKASSLDAGKEVLLAKPTPSRPTLTVPTRDPSEAFQKSSEVTPSPMTMVASFFAEQEPDLECKSFSQLLAGDVASPAVEKPAGTADARSSSSNAVYSNSSSASGSGSFAERLAARGLGQKAPGGLGSLGAGRSNTARFKSMTPSRLPIPRSPFLTIPPGLSPTTLLDSPVLLSTGQAEPSPTTGTFPLPPISQGSGSTTVPAADVSTGRSSDQDDSSSFAFKPFPKMGRNPISPLAKLGQLGLSHQQAFGQLQAQAQVQTSSPPSAPVGVTVSGALAMQTGSLSTSVHVPKLVIPLQSRTPSESMFQPPNDALEKAHLPPHPPVERPSEDGYNWRKYGQKQVKGSEFPRSYYKCTHPNCPVKKKVERSLDGQVTEIVYKGEHHHPKPQATRRMLMGASHVTNGSARDSSYVTPSEKADSSYGHMADSKNERVPLDPSSSGAQVGNFLGGATRTPEPSSGSTSDDEGSKAEDGDDDDPDSKRRKKEKAGDPALIPPLRTIREPRVVVQTTSDVDILDDGYRWRKYGQKVVKGNPYPRSYYKCTNVGCSVRKHVERSSTDPKAVITTYEGKHNHDVPAARNSSHDSGAAAVAAVSLPRAHTDISASSASTMTRPLSLQDQYLMENLLEDRLKGDNRTSSLDLVGGGLLRASISSDQQSRGQGPAETLVQTSGSMRDSGVNGGRTVKGAETLGQGLVLRPKEEQTEGLTNASSLHLTFSSSSSLPMAWHRD